MPIRLDAKAHFNHRFWIHLACYLFVVGALAILNYHGRPDKLWVVWVAGVWGIGLAAHAAAFVIDRGKLFVRAGIGTDRLEERLILRDQHGGIHERVHTSNSGETKHNW